MGSQGRGWRRDWIATGHKGWCVQERKPGALGSYDPGWNAEDLFESRNPEPDLDSQRNNPGGLYGNIDGFVLGAPRDMVGARGSGTCSHGAGRWRCWGADVWGAQRGAGAQRGFGSAHGLGNPEARFCQVLDLRKDSVTCNRSFRVCDWSSRLLPVKSAKSKRRLLLRPPLQHPPSHTHAHTTLQVRLYARLKLCCVSGILFEMQRVPNYSTKQHPSFVQVFVWSKG